MTKTDDIYKPGYEGERVTKPEARLRAAARAYGDARVAIERHEGARHGMEFTGLLVTAKRAMIELSSAARAWASHERAAERGAQKGETADAA